MRLPDYILDKQTYIIVANTLGSHVTIKVGKSVNPKKRLKQLQGSNPSRLQIHTTFMWDIEADLHKIFTRKGTHLRGEWFLVNSVDLDKIVNYLHEKSENILLEYDYYKSATDSSKFLSMYEEVEWANEWHTELQRNLTKMGEK